ncbi:MAG: ABC transporter substrate-binding protein [Candidatus Velthaea sp.]
MTNRARFIAATAAGTAALTAPAIVRAQAAKPLTIGFVPSTLFAPLFVAADRGYLRDAGFAPNLTPIVAGQDSMALIAQGQLDIAGAGVSAAFFNAVNRNLEVKFVASTGYQPHKGHPSALMIRQDLFDAGQRDAGVLRGKKIGWIGGAGATSQYYVARILRKFNLTLKDVEGVNIANPDQEVALARKAVDAMFTSAPFTEIFQEKKLARIIGTAPAGISATGIFFGPTLLRNPDNARAVMSALRKAAAEIAGNGYYAPDNLETYSKYTKQPVDLIKSADRYDFRPDLRIDQGTLQDMQTVFVDQGILTYKTPINEVRLVSRF